MSDLVVVALVGGGLGTLQVISTGLLAFLTNRNACGGAKCVQTMKKTLGIHDEVPQLGIHDEAPRGFPGGYDPTDP